MIDNITNYILFLYFYGSSDQTATASNRSQYYNLTGSDQEIDGSNNSSAISILQFAVVTAHGPGRSQVNISFKHDTGSAATIAIDKITTYNRKLLIWYLISQLNALLF